MGPGYLSKELSLKHSKGRTEKLPLGEIGRNYVLLAESTTVGKGVGLKAFAEFDFLLHG